ncbi:beta-N-acetylhexosaminidase [Paenibacillus sp. GCM10012307]|uniref:beta-N-acetylhexosaminidase n=1 Tax=Paenibacillus roseus TaxID=2798579 RepID=A0A934J866_9BACL|nr:beta-N-acetylhexosaminidase [Paenibacillus roseus]MBJ6362068.1 beta-N-acetylhexosaminidase [Paenibacillus roseus]
MGKRLSLSIILLGMAVLLASCGSPSQEGRTEKPPVSETNQPPATTMDKPADKPKPPTDPIKEQISRMTIEQKIGQLMLIGLNGTSLQTEAREMIENYHIGGFILYKYNITGPSQALHFLNELKASNGGNPVPLWLSVDQEGGKVSRMPEEFVKIPSARSVGRIENTDYAHGIGQALGNLLQKLGFNMDFAPVLDIDSNPNNPVIGDRSYGRKPQQVVSNGIAVMKGLQSKDIAAVVKHFPGHGDTSVDSHLDLPVVNKSLEELQSFELLPFEEAIKQGADAIMVAHLLIPALDMDYPASISKPVISGLLREKLGYDGVVITDDMMMGGITKHYGLAEAAVRSIQAGSDILLIGHDYKQQKAVLQALLKSVADKTLTEERIDQSVYRILKLKSKYHLEDKQLDSVDVKAVNREIQSALNAGKK